MKKSQSIIIILFCILTFLGNLAYSQTIKKGVLIKKSHLIEQLNPGEVHHYSIKLKRDEFTFIKLKQLGIDVIISTFDTEGNKIKEFNTLNGNTGPEFVSITSQDKGVYFVEVKPLNNQELAGKYEITVEKIEAKAISNSQKMDELFVQYDNVNTPGISVAVVKEGEIIFIKGYGSGNLEYDIRLLQKQFLI